MIRLLNKTFLLFLFVYFSFWVSHQFVLLSNEKKYNFYEQSENNTEDNNLENKTKTLFLAIIKNISGIDYSTFKGKSINSSDLFRAKEYALKNVTPPPKTV